jgi:EAL and modified HD-GYP domain-containing signal transduction protein
VVLRGRVDHQILEPGTGVAVGEPRLVVAGDGTRAAFDGAFARGAAGVLGWMFADPPQPSTGRKAMPSDVQVIVELIDRARREEPIDRLEATLKRDATVAFRLLRYLNSPAFGLTVEIGSLRHALMLLGYERLGRWLAVLLATASKDPEMRPVMFAALRRGLLFEQLLSNPDAAEMRGELFICGVFSLLDRMLRQPFGELLKSIPVADRVAEALVGGSGPLQPYLELARAIESESVFDIREKAEALLLGPSEINAALLRTLVAAREVG